METEQVPWLFAVLTAGWFGWMASRAGRSWALWAMGGAAFGLVASTLMLGLGRAVSIPYSDHQATMDRLKWILVAAALVLGIGWLLTAGLHRHRMRNQARAAEQAVTAGNEAKPPPLQKKPGPGKPE